MKLFQKGELKLLWPFYANSLISPLFLIAPIFFIPYFISIGFSMSQVGLVFAAFYTCSIIFEIPTGAFADLFGRKFSSILGFFIEGIVFLSLWFVQSFLGILILFSIYGFASTLYSGSYESWVFELARKKDKKLTKEFFIKDRALVAIALVFSGFIGALLVKSFGLMIIWPISAATYAITILCLIFGEETRIKNKLKFSSALKSTSKQTKQGIFFTLKNKTIMLLILISFIGGIATHFLGNMSWVSLLKEFSFPDYAFGYLWSFLSFLGIFSSFALKFVPNKKERNSLILIGIISVIVTLPVLFAKSTIQLLIILGAGTFISWMIYPISRNYLHRLIPSRLRATISSTESMLISTGGIISTILAGVSLDFFGPRITILIGTAMIMLQTILYFFIRENKPQP